MAAKRGLGKGIDSLIPLNTSINNDEKTGEELLQAEVEININEIEPNKDQPRKKFDEDSLAELAESIKIHGIIQPLIIRKNGKLYTIIAGERRWRAARMAGLKKVPVIIKDYSSREIMEIALIENIQRQDLNPIEEALAYKNLIDEYNLKQDEVAERVSKSRAAVTNSLRLLRLSDKVQQMVIDEIISSGHARTLLSLEDTQKQEEIATRILDEKLSVRETERIVKSLDSKKTHREKPKEADDIDPVFIRDAENRLKEAVGTRVRVSHKNNKGKIEIEYYSNEDLDRILDFITGKARQ